MPQTPNASVIGQHWLFFEILKEHVMTAINPSSSLTHLKESYQSSPFPSFKVSNYFYTYDKLFSHLIGTECTFIEVGVLNGGSLFMWRKYLGEKARIIGIDLNPEATKWRDHGF